MRIRSSSKENANILLGTMATIFIVSLIGANVLLNCTTRYNVSSSQVRGWKEALHAAESGGDIAYAEVRKTILTPSQAWSGWTNSSGVYTNSPATLGQNAFTTNSRVDSFYVDPATGNSWYRIRTQGTAPVLGVKRVGMDNRMSVGTKGDSLLRKIDFNYDHFVATYGPTGDGTNKAILPVTRPQITRRVEQVAAPVTPFDAAIKCSGSFYGLGSAAQIDSYNSANGSYVFAANNPSHPLYGDARSGHVQIGSSVATIMGMLYGNVATNGGTIVRSEYVTGTIDNNVPFTLPPYKLPTDLPVPQTAPTQVTGNVSITPSTPGSAANPTAYLLSSITGTLTIHPSGSAETYVAIRVTNDIIGKITVKAAVHAKIFFEGNIRLKARDIDNETGKPANMQFYGISPTDPSVTQRIDIDPPGDFAATFYAPSADYLMNGNPDIKGALVCKTFYANGNTSWHYDRALDNEGEAVDYKIVSYVEDTR